MAVLLKSGRTSSRKKHSNIDRIKVFASAAKPFFTNSSVARAALNNRWLSTDLNIDGGSPELAGIESK